MIVIKDLIVTIIYVVALQVPGSMRIQAAELSPALSSPNIFYLSVSGGHPVLVAQKILPEVIKGRFITRGGAGLADLTIWLVDTQDTMMEVAHSNKEGRFTLDLGVLESEELRVITSFHLQVTDRAGRKSRVGLSNAKTSNSRVIELGNIPFP